MEKVKFFVPGRPRPQGSMKFVKSKKTGKSVPITNQKLEAWRADIKHFAIETVGDRMTRGGCSVTMIFLFARPKSHYYHRKSGDVLRDDAPERMLKTPDIDKLIRAVLDALTGVVFTDDCEVDTIGAVKKWGAREGIEITVRGEFHAL
jgi:crossover junction endodeoxyribonuclease RusA